MNLIFKYLIHKNHSLLVITHDTTINKYYICILLEN